MKQSKNLACRIFKEQIDLIQQLPENERAEVLYKAILSAFNQIENQNDIQIENQNEYAYVSVSDSVSVLSKTVYSLLEKNIVCKEFSNNYGGRRIGAGRPVKEPEKPMPVPQPEPKQPVPTPPKDFIPPKDADEVYEYAQVNGMMCSKEQAQDFYDYYSGIGWRIGNEFRTPINDWHPFWRKWLRNPIATKQAMKSIPRPQILNLTARERQDLINKEKTQALLKQLREQEN